jgi:hypothetical protein
MNQEQQNQDDGSRRRNEVHSLAWPRNFTSQHLQVVDFLAEFRLGNAVEKLADARMRTVL